MSNLLLTVLVPLVRVRTFFAECEACGEPVFFTATSAADGEGRFGTCRACGHDENTWVDAS